MSRPCLAAIDDIFIAFKRCSGLNPGTRKEMHALILRLWEETQTTVFMVTHDLSEGFALGTRLLVFDKTRWDQAAPDAYGATVTYDIPRDRKAGMAAPGGSGTMYIDDIRLY